MALRDHFAAQPTCAGTEIDHVIGTQDGVFVVFDHQQGVALVAQLHERVEQHLVVARMQADGRLIQHVTHAAQVRAQLRSQPDALRLAAGQRRCSAIQRQIAEADFTQEMQPAVQFADHVTRNVGISSSQRPRADRRRQRAHGLRRKLRDRLAEQLHMARHRIQPFAVAGRAGFRFLLLPLVPGRLFTGLFGVETGQLQTGAHAFRTPAVLRIEREQPRVEFRETGAAARAGALGRIHLDRRRRRVRLAEPVQRREQVQHTLAVFERLAHGVAQRLFVALADHEIADRQFDRVFLEAVQPRPGRGRQELAVHPQMRMAVRLRPARQFGVVALATDHQRCQQADVLAAPLAQDARHHRVLGLRRDRAAAVGAVLHAQLHVHEAQEVVDLGLRRHRALAATAAGALRDRHGRRNAEHAVDIRLAFRLHELARVGIQRFEIAALAFAEHDVERQRGLARAGHAGHHGETVARNVDLDVLQVVLARAVHHDAVGGAGAQAGSVIVACRLFPHPDPLPLMREREQTLARLPAVLPLPDHGERAGVRGKGVGDAVFGERPPGVRGGAGDDLRRRAFEYQLTAVLAGFRAEVDQPVGGGDHVQIVFDHQHRMTGVQQFREGAEQSRDVIEVQAGGRFVEQEQLAAGGLVLLCRGGLGEEAGQLQPLRLAAGQRRHRLAQRHVVEADIDQRLQAGHRAVRVATESGFKVGEVAQPVQRIAYRHRQQVGNAAAVERDFAHFGAVARAVAVRAAQIHVGQKLHFDVFEAGAAAGRTAPLAGVERKGAGGVAALLGLGLKREQFAHRVERTDVRDGIRPRALADGGLVHHHHVGDLSDPFQRVVLARAFGRPAEVLQQRRIQHILDQRRLARTGYAGHGDQMAERDRDVDPLQVVRPGADQPERRAGGLHRPPGGERGIDRATPGKVVGGQRVGRRDAGRRAVEHDLAAARTGARADVQQAVGVAHDLRIMLDHDQRVAGILEAPHHADHAFHVARVQTDRRLVEHEQRIHQRGAERRREVDALHLAAGQRARLAVEIQVAEADGAQIAEPGADFSQQLFGRGIERWRQPERIHHRAQPGGRKLHDVMDGACLVFEPGLIPSLALTPALSRGERGTFGMFRR